MCALPPFSAGACRAKLLIIEGCLQVGFPLRRTTTPLTVGRLASEDSQSLACSAHLAGRQCMVVLLVGAGLWLIGCREGRPWSLQVC